MQARDRSLIDRDRAVPGLGTMLEPERLLGALRAAWPEYILSAPQLTYLRYKPETNCLAAYTLVIDGQQHRIHATAHRADRLEKLYNARKKFRGESALEPVVLPRNIAVRVFPSDRKLPALKYLNGAAARRKLLQEVLPEQSELWEARLDILRYKPERRLVARLHAPDGSRALLKLYHTGDFARARAGTKAFSPGAVQTAPLLGEHPEQHILVWRWLEASPGDLVLATRPEFAEEVGRALATLHAQPPGALPSVTRAEEGRPLRAAAEHVAYLLPELATRVRRLADALDARLRAAPPLQEPVHGDFSADQVLWTPAGVAVIDFDAAALADPAWDLGTFVAQLEGSAIRKDLTAEAVAATQDALENGYRAQCGSLPPRVALYTAAGLLRLSPHAFRTRQEGWPEETLALLARAEELLALEPAPGSTPKATYKAVPNATAVSGLAQLEDDPTLRFAAGALEPAIISPHLEGLFGPHTLRRAELLRHKSGRRALIGYTLGRSGEPLHLLGKVRAKGTDVKTHELQTFLWENGFDDASADSVSVVEPLGTLEPFRMTLQRKVLGINLETLLRPEAVPLMMRVAEAAHKLHRSTAPLQRSHTAYDELEILRHQLSAVLGAQPGYVARLERVLAACKVLLESLPDVHPVTLHRDFYPEQLLLDGERLYLLDLDLCAYGDPALDIGNFVAHIREYALRVLGNAAALSTLESTLTEHYCTLAGVSPQRINIYATLSLTRHIAISQRLPERRQLTGALLELSEARLGLGGPSDVQG